MASTSIVEATKSPDVEVPASLGIQVEADRSLETVVAASDGSSLGVTRLLVASAGASPTPRGILDQFVVKMSKVCKFFTH